MKILKTAIAALAIGTAAPTMAADFSFTGNLSNPNEVQTFNFTVGSPSTVTLRTYSYAGGTNAAGQVIARGGFDPILALFNSSGLLINQNDDGGCSNVAADPTTGSCYDTFLQSVLTAGNYMVSVMSYPNFANGPNFSDGFTGGGNFFGRNSQWAFDVLNVDQAVSGAVPEPATWAMLILGFGILGGTLRRRSAATKASRVRLTFA